VLVEGVDVVHVQVRDDRNVQMFRGDVRAEPAETLGPSIVMLGELAAMLGLCGVGGTVPDEQRIVKHLCDGCRC
jgi:hypothetical protein